MLGVFADRGQHYRADAYDHHQFSSHFSDRSWSMSAAEGSILAAALAGGHDILR
jgi:hypothetical protein